MGLRIVADNRDGRTAARNADPRAQRALRLSLGIKVNVSSAKGELVARTEAEHVAGRRVPTQCGAQNAEAARTGLRAGTAASMLLPAASIVERSAYDLPQLAGYAALKIG
ncbi:MAG TPA: hypothetical protein VKT77_18240 [Chthonomonadaceae bacterium]|nr:hypothetical protein [Chthonomonadaceae bacterium]